MITIESNTAYHLSVGLSASGLKHLSKTPRHYQIARMNPKKETSSQRLGTLEHLALLEPEKFYQVKIVDGSRNANKVKEEIAYHESNGFYVSNSEQFRKAESMAKGVLETSGTIRELLSGGIAESSLRCNYKGQTLKCRPDLLNKEKKFIVDVKTFTDLTSQNVEKQIARMKYHWASYFYLKVLELSLGIKTNNFIHIFVDIEGECGLPYILDDAALERAAMDVDPLIEKYVECIEKNNWPAYPDTILNCSIPSYAFNE